MAKAPRFRATDKSVEAGFRRIAVAEIEAALAIIDGHGLSSAEKVHKIRRQTKTLRALLRLVRPGFGRFARENRAFRDMARLFSGSRDTRVMLDTFDALVRRSEARPLSRGMAAMRERLAAACGTEADLSVLLGEAREGLCAARRRAERWSLADDDWAALDRGLKRTYRHARRAMRRTLATGDAGASHEWRKGVKYLAAQAHLLRKIRPDALKADVKAATRLGDLLGQRHDIDMLLDTIAGAPARYGDIVTLTQVAALGRLRLARLDRQARRLGEALFAKRPGRFAERWGHWWRRWRHRAA